MIMNSMLRTLVISLVFISAAHAGDPPQLFAKSEDFADAELLAQKIEKNPDGSLSIIASAQAGTEKVAFQILLPKEWKPWKPEGVPATFYQGDVTIKSLGKETEAFVQALAKAYGQKAEKFEFTQVTLAAISLKGDPKQAAEVPIKLKLFYESEKEDEYAEFFLNLDLPHGVVQFQEKDLEYRKAIIRFLSIKSRS